ncbi:MAG: hypothetical protein LBB07_01750 [Bifidobacteriaceae bacterium]|jgi:hypothetical protein|nr:hypothetical protein [Bifidobacteriaceae bacterium]
MSYEKNSVIKNRYKITRLVQDLQEFEIYLAVDTLLDSTVFLYSTKSKSVSKSLIEKSKLVNSSIILPTISSFAEDEDFFISAAPNGKSIKKKWSKSSLQNSLLEKEFIVDLVYRLAKECERVGKTQFYPLGLNSETIFLDDENKINVIGQGLIINKENYNVFGEYEQKAQSKMCAGDLVALYNYLASAVYMSEGSLSIKPNSVLELIKYFEGATLPEAAPETESDAELKADAEDDADAEKDLDDEKEPEIKNEEDAEQKQENLKKEAEVQSEELPQIKQPPELEPEKIADEPKKNIKVSLVFTYLLIGVALASTIIFVLFLTGVLK